jgi:hypothetical protein
VSVALRLDLVKLLGKLRPVRALCLRGKSSVEEGLFLGRVALVREKDPDHCRAAAGKEGI